MTAFDCTSCGACCVTAGTVPVDYGENGNGELTPKALTRSVKGHAAFASWEWEFGMRYMKHDSDGRCHCLVGTVNDKVQCSIYSKRPKVCRGFEAGADACLRARADWVVKFGNVSVA